MAVRVIIKEKETKKERKKERGVVCVCVCVCMAAAARDLSSAESGLMRHAASAKHPPALFSFFSSSPQPRFPFLA